MRVAWTTFLSSMLIGTIILFVQFLLLKSLGKIKFVNSKILMVLNFLFIIRMCLPFEFGFTITVPSKKLLPMIKELIDQSIFNIENINLTVFQGLLVIWGAGTVYKIYTNLRNYIKFKKVLRLENDEGIVNSLNGKAVYKFKIIKNIDSPAVVGLINPTILLPNYQFSEEELGFIFKHELIHISHFDLYIKYFYEVLISIYWWNPVMYLFREQMSHIIELKTDESVIKSLNKKEKTAYIQTLIKVREYQNLRSTEVPLAYSSAFFFSDRSELLQRSKNILQKKRGKSNLISIGGFTLVCLYLITSITFDPHYISKEHQNEVFSITTKNSYFRINDSGTFDLYIDDKHAITVTQIQIDNDNNLKKIKIKNN